MILKGSLGADYHYTNTSDYWVCNGIFFWDIWVNSGYICSHYFRMYLFKSSIKRRIPINWDWSLIKSLLKFGVPIMLIGFSWTLFTTVDRIMISMFYNSEALGYYGIALMMFQVLMMAPRYSRRLCIRK